MCTVSFIPRHEGYLLAMNRDEKITRGQATPPTVVEIGAVPFLIGLEIVGHLHPLARRRVQMLAPSRICGGLTDLGASLFGRKKLYWRNLREVDDARKISRC